MYLSTSSCTLCKEHISNKVKHNLKTSTADNSKTPLLNLVEVFNQNIIFSHCNICSSCYKLLNELDDVQQREKEITDVLKGYLSCKEEVESDGGVKVKVEIQEEEIELPELNLKRLPIKIKRVKSGVKTEKEVDYLFDDEFLCDSLPQDNDTDGEKDVFEKIQNSIKEHLNKHVEEQKTKAKPASALCEICGHNFKSKSGYDMHMKKHNTAGDDLKLLSLNKADDEDYQCDICGKQFNKKEGKKRHLAIHTGETRYQCEYCGKKFIHHSSFHMHKKIHAGERNYNCSFCNRKFLNNSHLKRHVRSIHIMEKRHVCKNCGRTFGEKYNLEAHVRQRTCVREFIDDSNEKNKSSDGAIEDYEEVALGGDEDTSEGTTVIYQIQEDGTLLSGVALLKNKVNVQVNDPTGVLYTL